MDGWWVTAPFLCISPQFRPSINHSVSESVTTHRHHREPWNGVDASSLAGMDLWRNIKFPLRPIAPEFPKGRTSECARRVELFSGCLTCKLVFRWLYWSRTSCSWTLSWASSWFASCSWTVNRWFCCDSSSIKAVFSLSACRTFCSCTSNFWENSLRSACNSSTRTSPSLSANNSFWRRLCFSCSSFCN